MTPEETRLPTAAEWPAIASLWKRTGHELVARFGGSSMAPTIPPETEVLLRCGDEAARGDVVAFLARDQVVLHRVEAVDAAGFILTRGDGQAVPDAPLWDRGALLGRVVQIRQLGTWISPPGPPESLARRLLLAICLGALYASPSLGEHLIRLLRAGRRRAASLRRPSGADSNR